VAHAAHGKEDGNAWVPAEVNTSIRPEWFYHPAEDDKVKTVPQLLDTYYASIGRNGTFLLNFPIMPDGTIHPTDVKHAIEMGKVVKQTFAVNLAKKAKAEASNTRGGSSKFGPENAVDDKKEHVLGHGRQRQQGFAHHQPQEADHVQSFPGAGTHPASGSA
jgi:alpha-L-fucosidase